MTNIRIGSENTNQINFFFRKDKGDLPTLLKSFFTKPSKFEHAYSLESDIKIYVYLGRRINVVNNDFRIAGSKAYSVLKNYKLTKATINIDFENGHEFKAFAEGLAIGSYEFEEYKKRKNEKDYDFQINTNLEYSEILNEVLIVNQNVSMVRNLTNKSAHEVNTLYLANLVSELATQNDLKATILNEIEIKKLGMGLLSAVGAGGSTPPRLALIEYIGNPNIKSKTALIGKGIVYDSGGLNIKPTGYMEDMKCDMAGAATVLGTVLTLKQLSIPVNVVGLLAIAENSVDANSYKPGDVFKAYNGLYVEVTNTDAEGRLVMADALAYAQDKLEPTDMIDLATLTGACMVALGQYTAGVMGNNKEMIRNLLNSSIEVDESMWELEIKKEFKIAMKSKLADLRNTSATKLAGAQTAAAFLKEFVGNTNWTHIDIAGPAFLESSHEYFKEGATGFGIRTLVKYFKNRTS